ncbi:MAG: hypothetical protein A3C93_06520 [Candidatus Lloydbacteria bacterium RIFCSPHIGHO2_02_FULL_54_17]|uniref:Uncharacterized protein n=1 Tax=Candidatus Lloydbacteria bacterium RIFCSPHIGHO2_02_FULL_54_17 TaxID=1798664 RepID=A0A1G2DC08_9BACT|nr:MAG: hypothetical protein A2762_05295 [Candidatus Lloydbacteria bacterium RIFCSPHIGHO2_01_FULL_54_11]OGZ11155.1 MAG: hypothetical protein A3C93_06520 [Candidatus Lloydbacteria bacterium RIFCSPHIGHO2_02_FULL_54_17]OGZ14990.1 MAG: hypothetical protein A2948_00900 [Candidatus Lloydbacteria bacterium RIFCSPLOWO2_01_FULL_54_18]OGZ15259.1 MAG: hypothetical protein A3H76_03190 [Candidatus Lloydbacteria bacterium RIFCSPLOWO2_02_FULL_54_12]
MLPANHIFPRFIRIPLVIAVVILNIYFVFIERSFTVLYYVLWLGGVGYFVVQYREAIVFHLRQWKISPLLKFLILGYGAMLAEEFIVGLVHAANEGLSLATLLLRVSQFWAFNVFAFTGFIFGWYFFIRRYSYSLTDIFFISGLWGLFSEHTLSYLSQNPIAAVLLILPTMCTYNLIIAPALFSVAERGTKVVGIAWRYSSTLLLFLVFSIPPMAVLWFLRSTFPDAFPPCEYISCT